MFNLSDKQIIALKDLIKSKEEYLNSVEYQNLMVCTKKIDIDLHRISVKSEILGMYDVLFEIIKNNHF